MAFGDSLAQKDRVRATYDSPFFRTTPGDYRIRILDTEETIYWRYWLPVNVGGTFQDKSINVGKDNPIKRYMDALGKDHPQYKSPNRRFVMNILDRTPVIKVVKEGVTTTYHPNVIGEYVDAEGKPVAGTPVPNDAVKIFECGPQAFELIVQLNGRMRSRVDMSRMLQITETDLTLSIRGEGVKKNTFPSQAVDSGEQPVPAGLVRYDLKKMYAPLPNDAVDRIFNGKEDWNIIMAELGFVGNYPTLA